MEEGIKNLKKKGWGNVKKKVEKKKKGGVLLFFLKESSTVALPKHEIYTQIM